jgi:hypothetical protein
MEDEMSIIPKSRGNVINYYSGNTNNTINKSSGSWISLLITNDGASNLSIIVNNITMIIKPGETLDEDFIDFNTVQIITNVSYRIWLRG